MSAFADPQVRGADHSRRRGYCEGAFASCFRDPASAEVAGSLSRRHLETRQGRRPSGVDATPGCAKGGGLPESTLSRDTPRDAAFPSRRYPGHAKGRGLPESTPSPDTPRDAAFLSR